MKFETVILIIESKKIIKNLIIDKIVNLLVLSDKYKNYMVCFNLSEDRILN